MTDPKKFLSNDPLYVKYTRELKHIPVMNTKRERSEEHTSELQSH